MTTTTITLPTAPVTITEHGEGRPVLLLHGGGGPGTVSGFAAQLAAAGAGTRVLAPIHPGFDGTPRPDRLTTISGLARLYVDLLGALDLHDVTVVGNSIGGWTAGEMATLGSPRVSGYVLVDAVGIELPGQPTIDFFSLSPAQIAERAYFRPERFGVDPAALPPAAQAVMAGNREALSVYAAAGMSDPSLAGRLGAVTTPTLVVWGEADRIAGPEIGRAFAAAIPGAEFTLMPEVGHMPQLEAPDRLTGIVSSFAAAHTSSRSAA